MSRDPSTDFSQKANPYSSGTTSMAPGHPPLQKKHSGFGICSFIGAVFSGILFVAMMALVGVAVAGDMSGSTSENSLMFMLIGLLGLGLIISSLVSMGLGIVCLFQKDRKRLFGILGLIIGVVMFLAIAGIFALGAVA